LVATTFTAGWEKIFSPLPRLGFLAQAHALESAIAAGQIAGTKLQATQTIIFNNKLDAAICGILMMLVTITIADSVRVWSKLLRGTVPAETSETPFIPSRLEAESV
jgi:carbon starvation protein